MMRYFGILSVLLLAFGCSDRHPKTDPIGVWQNTTHWNNNAITLTVRPDSMMLFKVEKSFCPGTKFFVSCGKWHIEQDSFLVMEQYTDGREFDLGELFPELVQMQIDSQNVMVLGVSAKLIMRDSLIYDVTPEGLAAPDRVYRKTSLKTEPE